MIRRDFLMREVHEFVQACTRAVQLRQRLLYREGLEEIKRVFLKLWGIDSSQLLASSLTQLMALCEGNEESLGDELVALANLLAEQGNLYSLENRAVEARQSRALALGLYLESLPKRFVSLEVVTRIENLIGQADTSALAPDVLRRLFSYLETRGSLARAENVLFDWAASKSCEAFTEGLAFYERLALLEDEELERGELPRSEVEEGKKELLRLSGPESS